MTPCFLTGRTVSLGSALSLTGGVDLVLGGAERILLQYLLNISQDLSIRCYLLALISLKSDEYLNK